MPDDLDTKPYRPPGQPSGPDVGRVAGLLMSICLFAIIAVAWHWPHR